jgi:uncharacterized membrane-anchored protein
MSVRDADFVVRSGRRSPVLAMRSTSVPRLDARYWTAISLASVAGCNLGDFISLYLHQGHWLGLRPLALLFAALILGERRSGKGGEIWYWSTIIVLRTAATNIADLATHTFQLSYPWVIAGLEFIQVLVILRATPRPFLADGEGSGRPIADLWYWASMLTAGALGTALGDCIAEDFKLGTGASTLVLGAILAVVLAWRRRSAWSTKTQYWFAIIAVRAAGTTAGDFLAFKDGVGLGLPLSSGVTMAIFVATLVLWRTRAPRQKFTVSPPPTLADAASWRPCRQDRSS